MKNMLGNTGNIMDTGSQQREELSLHEWENWVMNQVLTTLTQNEMPGVYFNDAVVGEVFQRYLYRPDLYMTKGWSFLGCEGKTFVDFKRFLAPGTISRYMRLLASLKKDGIVDNFVILYESTSSLGENSFQFNKDGYLIISIDAFLKKQSRENTDKNKSVNELKKYLEKEIEKYNSVSASERNLIADARVAFSQCGVALFLGAGVSMSAGLPAWGALLKKIMTQETKSLEKDFAFVSEQCFNSYIIAARYIKELLRRNSGGISETDACLSQRFKELIRNELYREKVDMNESSAKYPLIYVIGEMIARNRETKSDKQNSKPNVDCVITYNYDTLIEEELKHRGIEYVSIYENNRGFKGDFPIYHVHGLLPQDDNEVVDAEIVISEEQYHNSYKEAYNWVTVEQLHALRSKTCFFIGLSMSDPNLRRLLDLAKDTNGVQRPHYVFLQDQTMSAYYSDENKKVIEKMMNGFGLNVIWYNEHKELPGILQQVYSAV